MVAENYDGGVGIEFGVGAGGDIAHGDEDRVGDAGGLELPGFADVQQKGGVGLLAEFGEGFCGNFGL